MDGARSTTTPLPVLNKDMRVISGSRRDVNEICTLLGCYAHKIPEEPRSDEKCLQRRRASVAAFMGNMSVTLISQALEDRTRCRSVTLLGSDMSYLA